MTNKTVCGKDLCHAKSLKPSVQLIPTVHLDSDRPHFGAPVSHEATVLDREGPNSLGPGWLFHLDTAEKMFIVLPSPAGERASPPLQDWAPGLEQQKGLDLEVRGDSQSAAPILAKVNGLQLWVTCWNISSFLKNKSERVWRGWVGEVLKSGKDGETNVRSTLKHAP